MIGIKHNTYNCVPFIISIIIIYFISVKFYLIICYLHVSSPYSTVYMYMYVHTLCTSYLTFAGITDEWIMFLNFPMLGSTSSVGAHDVRSSWMNGRGGTTHQG